MPVIFSELQLALFRPIFLNHNHQCVSSHGLDLLVITSQLVHELLPYCLAIYETSISTIIDDLAENEAKAGKKFRIGKNIITVQ